MTVFSAALSALNLTYAEAAAMLPSRDPERSLNETMVKDMARGKSRVPPDVWAKLNEMFAWVEDAADDIIADQGESDGGECLRQISVDVSVIGLPHTKLREAAAARAMLVLGPRLLAFSGG